MSGNPPVLSAAGALAFGAEGLIFFSRRAVLPSYHGPRTRVGRAAIGSDSNLDAQNNVEHNWRTCSGARGWKWFAAGRCGRGEGRKACRRFSETECTSNRLEKIRWE